ncbi:RNA-directed DNA polymerase, eukaryota [Tanacetum coccineum]
MSWCKKKKKQTLLFKVDFEKAYYSVRWDFLDDVLGKFGFGDKWRKWIQCCLHSSKGSIIINGSPTDEFQFGRGLKQGVWVIKSRCAKAKSWALRILEMVKPLERRPNSDVRRLEEKGSNLLLFPEEETWEGPSTLSRDDVGVMGKLLKNRFPKS